MSRSLSINLYLRPSSIAIYGKFYLCCLYTFRLFSGLRIVQILSINYPLRFVSVKIQKICLYWSVFSTDKIERLFSIVLIFLIDHFKLYELNQ